jgi:hypothetical protein
MHIAPGTSAFSDITGITDAEAAERTLSINPRRTSLPYILYILKKAILEAVSSGVITIWPLYAGSARSSHFFGTGTPFNLSTLTSMIKGETL